MSAFTTKFITQEKLPFVIEPIEKKISRQEFLSLLKGNKKFIQDNLLKYGGILFRNFPINNADEFSETIETLGVGKFVDYIGGDSPRSKVKGSVYTSTELPPSLKIPLHNELSFVKKYPRHIFFYCDIAPEKNGETIIADARKVYQSLHKEVKNRFVMGGLKYVSSYYHHDKILEWLNKFKNFHKPWADVFDTDNKKEVEEKCRKHDFGYKWNQNDWLQIHQIRPAVIPHPITQENVWFNQMHLYDFNPKFCGFWNYIGAKIIYARPHTRLHEVYFADGTKIPREDIYHIMDELDKNTIYFPWQKGDLLMLDNVLAMHGRAPFKGKRRILTALTN